MRTVLLTVSYDGTDFCGWQRQRGAAGTPAVRTVQGVLETALETLHGVPVKLSGSGRTDSGVHARAQAAHFFSPIDSIPVENYPRALNGQLPRDVRVTDACLVPADFHARYSATSRIYRYFMFCGSQVQAVQAPYVWHLRAELNLTVMNAMAACLSGEMDCASFAAAGDASRSTYRYIERAHFFTVPGFPDGTLIVFEIAANAFLWKMVRTITGTIVTLARTGKGVDEFQKIIAACDRRRALVTAPPNGLFLWEVQFSGVRRPV
ncbi:MAG: tRNA pseudouridine(38-40) synthase TruA [Treponema sp.]|nr:tRNA pseudouridine(38-40) synthase TruA [Treponema sp.]